MPWRDMAINAGYEDTDMTLDEAAAYIEQGERERWEQHLAEQQQEQYMLGNQHMHLSNIRFDEDGWEVPACLCGWEFGASPDNETTIDVLMEHAYGQGYQDGYLDALKDYPIKEQDG